MSSRRSFRAQQPSPIERLLSKRNVTSVSRLSSKSSHDQLHGKQQSFDPLSLPAYVEERSAQIPIIPIRDEIENSDGSKQKSFKTGFENL
jgi:hypothetical protein